MWQVLEHSLEVHKLSVMRGTRTTRLHGDQKSLHAQLINANCASEDIKLWMMRFVNVVNK